MRRMLRSSRSSSTGLAHVLPSKLNSKPKLALQAALHTQLGSSWAPLGLSNWPPSATWAQLGPSNWPPSATWTPLGASSCPSRALLTCKNLNFF